MSSVVLSTSERGATLPARRRMERSIRALRTQHEDCQFWLRRLRSQDATDAELEMVLLMLDEYRELVIALLGEVARTLAGKSSRRAAQERVARCRPLSNYKHNDEQAPTDGTGERAVLARPTPQASEALRPSEQTLLSERQQEVLALMAEGVSTEEIATTLSIGIETVKTHIKALLVKLDATSRTQAVATALRKGLLT